MWVHEGVVLCVHVVLCVVVSCWRVVVNMWLCWWCVCGVLFFLCVYMWCWVLVFCVCTCGVGEAWHAENPLCTFKTPPCVPATGTHVEDMRACCRYTRRRLNVHTGVFSSLSCSLSLLLSLVLSFLFFSRLVSLLTCLFLFFPLFSLFSFLHHLLSSSLSAHTETTSDRQVTLPTKNGHAPRDPLNQERAINLSILAMSHPGKYSRVESNQATSSTPGGAHPSMPVFHVQRFICAAWV